MWQLRTWEYLQLLTWPYLGSLSASLIFASQEKDNIVVQAWKLHGILIIATMPGPNFGSEQ